MPIAERDPPGPSVSPEKPSKTLVTGVHQFLSLCTSESSVLVPHTPLKGDAAFEYLHRIVLATTAPAATLILSLCLTQTLLAAMKRRDDAMLKGFFYDSPGEPVSQKVLAIWSVAIIIADANMNDNAFAATSWAQVTVFKEPRVVAAWKRWAGDLMDWDFDVKEAQWKEFLSSGLLRSLCNQNSLFAAQISSLQCAQAEKDAAIAAELAQTKLHPTWTVVHHEQLKKVQEEQLQLQLLIQQQQQQYQQSFNSQYIATPPFSPVFQSRASSLQSRRSLPVFPQSQQQQHHVYAAQPSRYAPDGSSLPPSAPPNQQQQYRASFGYQAFQHQQHQNQQLLHARPSMPRLSITTYEHAGHPSPSTTSFERSNSRLSSYTMYESGAMTPSSAHCNTPLTVRNLQTPMDDSFETASTTSTLAWADVAQTDVPGPSTRKLPAGLGQPQSHNSFREIVSLGQLQQQQVYGQQYNGLPYSTEYSHHHQNQLQQCYQAQAAWATPDASFSGNMRKEDDLSTGLSSMQLGEAGHFAWTSQDARLSTMAADGIDSWGYTNRKSLSAAGTPWTRGLSANLTASVAGKPWKAESNPYGPYNNSQHNLQQPCSCMKSYKACGACVPEKRPGCSFAPSAASGNNKRISGFGAGAGGKVGWSGGRMWGGAPSAGL